MRGTACSKSGNVRVEGRRLAASVFFVIGLLLMAPAVAQAQAPTTGSMSPIVAWAGSSTAVAFHGTNLGTTATTTVTIGSVTAVGSTVNAAGTQVDFTIP